VGPEQRPAIVFAGAPLDVTPRLKRRVEALREPIVVAADSGARTALAFGLPPHVVIGDFDSLDEATRRDLERLHVTLERYPVAKDATDGQLALQRALELEPATVLLLGYLNGPRLDMTLSSALLLAQTDTPVMLADEHNECRLLRAPGICAWAPEPNEVISLLPLDVDCAGVTTEGLRYPLASEALVFGDTRGISNEPSAQQVAVSLQRGRLLITRHFPRL
jgi:thiamine pyrophosphokinase